MATTFLYCFLFLLSLVVFPTLSLATTFNDVNDNLFLSSETLKLQAESFIRVMNLSPKHDVNIGVGHADYHMSKVSESRIVEKHIDLMGFGFGRGRSDQMVQNFSHHAGYYRLPNSRDARMFYFFFESRNNKAHDPVVIWLSGGPGCSSQLALFYENGPFHIANNMSLTRNNYGWDTVSNIIFVDQPTGTGFSYSSNHNDLRHNGDDVSEDLYHFIQEFFKEHPQYVNNDFYITGESYAGHYIPAFASRIRKGNIYNQGKHINLKGLAIGNGFTNPEIQYKASLDFALQTNLINKSNYDRISSLVSRCEQLAKLYVKDNINSSMNAYDACDVIHKEIMNVIAPRNYYDIRKECKGKMCYDFSKVEKFLNKKSVKKALHVGDIEFVLCSSKVHHNLRVDWMRNYAVGIPKLLKDGIKLLVYAGEFDLIGNWLGNERWVREMEWEGFNSANSSWFFVDGKTAGEKTSYGPLSFLKVHEAGHMVPMDQPEVALEMLSQWMNT